MILYRVVDNDKSIINKESVGCNSFNYDKNTDYLHFFILPENAKVYKKLKYDNENKKSFVYKCDIPYKIIKNNFGIGMYRWYFPSIRTPFLEVRIKKSDFVEEFIVEKSDKIKDEWCNKEIYNRFVDLCVDKREPIISIHHHPFFKLELNDNFNYLDYFSKEDLLKENIDISNYPEPIDEDSIEYFKLQKKDNTLKNKLEIIKRILLNRKPNKEEKDNNKKIR